MCMLLKYVSTKQNEVNIFQIKNNYKDNTKAQDKTYVI